MTQTVPLPAAEQVLQQIADLQESIARESPDYKDLLRIIHSNLKKDENLVHLLSEEQIGVIVNGLGKMKGIVIIEATKKEVKKRNGKSISLEDLM